MPAGLDPEGRNPPIKIRINPETQRKARTRASYLGLTLAEYVTYAIDAESEEFFERIDRPAHNGGHR